MRSEEGKRWLGVVVMVGTRHDGYLLSTPRSWASSRRASRLPQGCGRMVGRGDGLVWLFGPGLFGSIIVLYSIVVVCVCGSFC